MRLIHLFLSACFVLAAPVLSHAAGGSTVRAISFTASSEKGKSDPKLARYEGILRGNTRFESFHYTGESSTTVPPGGKGSLSTSAGQIELESDTSGNVQARRGRAAIQLPVVFMAGGGSNGQASGVIVIRD